MSKLHLILVVEKPSTIKLTNEYSPRVHQTYTNTTINCSKKS